MGEVIEDRLRRAAHDLQMKPASPRSRSNSEHAVSQTLSRGQAVQSNHTTSANMPPTKKHHVAKRAWPKLAITTVAVVILGAGFYTLFTRLDSSSTPAANSPKLPAAIISQISDFVPYFFRGATPQGFTFSTKNVSYSAGVLFFQVQDQNGNKVVISEQALPNDFANSRPKGDRTASNVDGNGAISNRDGRTIGTLITSKTPRTFINVNAAETVSASAVEAIMSKLVPLPDNR